MSHVHQFRTQLGALKARALRWLGLTKSDWDLGLPEEAKFWARALQDQGRNWSPNEYAERTNPSLPLQPELRELIAAPPGTTVSILDVGSGPLSRVGRVWEHRNVVITAVDPLADEYLHIIDELGVVVPVRPQRGEGEKLRETFPNDFFDLAYASNCLDHARDPLLVIREMLEVVKPNAFLYLWHYPNVGISERYSGLHQWNFDECNGDMTISDGRSTFSLNRELSTVAESRCTREFSLNTEVIIARVKKLRRGSVVTH